MRVKTISILLCWVLILISPGVLAQQTAPPNQSWDILKQTLTAGRVMVKKKTGKKFSGRFNSISDTERYSLLQGTCICEHGHHP